MPAPRPATGGEQRSRGAGEHQELQEQQELLGKPDGEKICSYLDFVKMALIPKTNFTFLQP